MFGIKYETRESVCDMYFSLSTGSLKSYLQWFPFTKLTNAHKSAIKSEDFYKKYIHTTSFVLFPFAIQRSENFLQNGDGSFRDSLLVSLILYLLLQTIGKEIFEHYSCQRPADISAYYAGNYEHMHTNINRITMTFPKKLIPI